MNATKYRTQEGPALATRRELSASYSTQELFDGNLVCADKITERFLFIAQKVICKRGEK